MYYETKALAHQLDPSWRYSLSELSTLYEKAKAYETGKKISFGGRDYPPLYKPKNDTLINLFQISDSEQSQLRTIISHDMALSRHRIREQSRREAIRADDVLSAEELAKQREQKRIYRETVWVDEERLAKELEKKRQQEQSRREAIKADEVRLVEELKKQKQRQLECRRAALVRFR